MIRKTVTRSCCGTSTLILETLKPIRKSQIHIIEGFGWVVPKSHTDVGLFYCFKDKVYCSGTFGSNMFKVTVRSEVDLSALEEALESAVNS